MPLNYAFLAIMKGVYKLHPPCLCLICMHHRVIGGICLVQKFSLGDKFFYDMGVISILDLKVGSFFLRSRVLIQHKFPSDNGP